MDWAYLFKPFWLVLDKFHFLTSSVESSVHYPLLICGQQAPIRRSGRQDSPVLNPRSGKNARLVLLNLFFWVSEFRFSKCRFSKITRKFPKCFQKTIFPSKHFSRPIFFFARKKMWHFFLENRNFENFEIFDFEKKNQHFFLQKLEIVKKIFFWSRKK